MHRILANNLTKILYSNFVKVGTLVKNFDRKKDNFFNEKYDGTPYDFFFFKKNEGAVKN